MADAAAARRRDKDKAKTPEDVPQNEAAKLEKKPTQPFPKHYLLVPFILAGVLVLSGTFLRHPTHSALEPPSEPSTVIAPPQPLAAPTVQPVPQHRGASTQDNTGAGNAVTIPPSVTPKPAAKDALKVLQPSGPSEPKQDLPDPVTQLSKHAESSGASEAGDSKATIDVKPVAAMDTVLSDGKPVTSDVKGNLGPASVVSSPVIRDWLKDRWQAASDMQGTPIKGPHWLEMDLCQAAVVRTVKIDWEGAYATEYRIEGKLRKEDPWAVMVDARKTDLHQDSAKRNSIQGPKAHVYHSFPVSSEWAAARTGLAAGATCADSAEAVRFVRLYIERPAKRWGASVWHWQLMGAFLPACDTGSPCT